MNRLLLAAAGVVALAGGLTAEPPVGVGRERTMLEQEQFLSEASAPMVKEMTPAFAPRVIDDVRSWVVEMAGRRLGRVPVVPCEMW